MGCHCKANKIEKLKRVELDENTHAFIRQLTLAEVKHILTLEGADGTTEAVRLALTNDKGEAIYASKEESAELPFPLIQDLVKQIQEHSGLSIEKKD